jgi:2,3-diketo-5-methylthio-1-phosphopentane phosphatase
MSNIFSNGVSRELKLCRPEDCQIWLDFDGTITRQDVLDELIKRYSVNDSWKIIEARWQAGLTGSRQCLQEQLKLLRISPEELEQALDSIELDEGIFVLLELLKSRGVPAVILSDSADIFIERILHRHNIRNLPVRSNTVVRRGPGFELHCLDGDPLCEFGAAHCKCNSVKVMGDPKRKSIYIGDGRSDLCAARKVDYVFAKGILAQCLEKESIPFIRYSTLNDVAAVLSKVWLVPTSTSSVAGRKETNQCQGNCAAKPAYPKAD